MKPKNKKIFALLCLPVLVMTMILPLCSFFPGLDDPNGINRSYDYSPAYGLNVDVGVKVNLVGPLQFYSYTGYVYDALNCTVNYDEESVPVYPYIATYSDYVSSAYHSSLEFYNDDLSVADYLPGGGFLIDYSVILEPTLEFDEATEYTVSTFLDGRFNITYAPPEISDNYVALWFSDGNAGYPLDLVDFEIAGTIIYETVDFSGTIVGYNGFDFYRMSINPYLSVGDLQHLFTYDLALDILNNANVDNVHRIISFDFQLYPPNYDDGRIFSDEVGACYVSCTIMPVDYAKSQYFDYLSNYTTRWFSLGYERGYDNGYGLGYNAGVSDGPDTWKSLGSFLTGTVGSFFKFEIWNGFSLGTVMSIFVGAMLLIAFLKIFAGG